MEKKDAIRQVEELMKHNALINNYISFKLEEKLDLEPKIKELEDEIRQLNQSLVISKVKSRKREITILEIERKLENLAYSPIEPINIFKYKEAVQEYKNVVKQVFQEIQAHKIKEEMLDRVNFYD